MKPKSTPFLRASHIAILTFTVALTATPLLAQTTWDGGGSADTNVSTKENWNNDTAPPFNGTTAASFGSVSGNAANINTDAFFSSILFNRTSGGFTLSNGGASLKLKASTTGGTKNLTVSSSLVGNAVIDAPVVIDKTLGGSLFVVQNNKATTLDINGALSGLATAPTTNDFQLRYEGAASSITRIDGTISNLTNLQQASGAWAGDLVIGGDQSLATAAITISSGGGFGNPTTAARLVLGESSADEQTWGGISLGNVMNLAIGGTITANTFSGNTANTKITGASSAGSISFNSGTIGANVVLGGAGTNENDLSIIKKSSGVLNINSTTATYTGATTVEAGTLNISSATALASPITVKAAATLSGEGSTSSSLTFDAGTSTLSFDPATPGSFTAGSVTTTGATIVANPSTATTVGQTYTVLTRSTGTFSSTEVASFLGGGRSTIGGTGTSTITYTADAPASLTWKGNDGTNPSFWDVATTFNWSNGSADRFFSNDAVTFDDTASSFSVVIQGTSASPGNMVFNHSSNNYTISGGTIVGSGSLTKSGSGTLTLAQASGSNSFSGALNINGGTLSISALNRIGGGASTRAVQLGGGTLEYTYSVSNAETSDTIPLVLNSGNSGLRITGSYVTGSVNAPTAAVTLRLGAAITGSGNLEKSGSGILAIGKNSATTLGNTFSGSINVTAGALDIRNPDSLGAISGGTTLTNGQLELFSFGQNAGVTFDAEPITISGASFIRSKNEDTDSDILHVLTGPLTLNASSVLGLSSPKAVALSGTVANTINSISTNVSSLELTGIVTTGAGSILKLGLTPSVVLPVVQSTVPQTVTLSGALSGSGSVETQGAAASVYTLADPEYSGNTTVNGGILSLGADNSSNNASTVNIAASGATLDLTFAGTDTVDKLFIGGVQQPAGVYEAVGNAGSGTEIAQITGSGTLTVTSGPAGYSNWQSANGAGSQTVDQDHDNDGVDNGVEYFLGGNTNTTGFTPLPVPVGGAVTWVKAASYTGVFNTDFKVQSSTDLISWTNAPAGTGPGQVNVSGNNVTYTLPTGAGKTFVRLLVNPN